MTDTNNSSNEMGNDDDTVMATAERDALESQAKALGIRYHPNISDENLRDRIRAVNNQPSTAVATPTNQKFHEARKKAHELVRIQVTCRNPAKTDWSGEIFRFGNAAVGQMAKYVPFNGKPYHVPRAILNCIKRRQYAQAYKETLPNKIKVTRYRNVDEFSVTELPPLTKAELAQLANRQAMAAGTTAEGS